MPSGMKASMCHDLEAGKQLELPWLSGGVVDLGSAVGVATPMNRAVRDILALYAQGTPAAIN
jgi:2-dehydropantoate 2-reductase